ncbi:DMT family transporter [Thioalkalivibrio sp. XN279]|uniref:DMT family transporter n=1 Tax=Thioalkalivibrio sp. XN279 TaxID=2714953 RepID=UPI00140C49DD|nr:DMT family transporter [Thioalkalivibrio sp. XN279]
MTAGVAPVLLRQGPAEWGLLLALVALWGSSFMLVRVSLDAFTPVAVTAGRLLIGAGVLLLVLLATRRRLPLGARTWVFFTVMAVVGNALPFFLIAWGQASIPSGLTGILMAVMPLVVLVLAHFFVAGEHLNARRLAGFVLGFVGVVVLTGPEAVAALVGREASLLSQLAVLGAAVCYGVAAIVARRGPVLNPVVTAAAVLSIAGILVGLGLLAGIAGSGAAGALHAQVGLAPGLALAALGALSTGLATVVYFSLVARAGPTFLSLINYLIPVWAVVLGALVLHERLPPRAFAALGLILAGVVIARWQSLRRRSPA